MAIGGGGGGATGLIGGGRGGGGGETRERVGFIDPRSTAGEDIADDVKNDRPTYFGNKTNNF